MEFVSINKTNHADELLFPPPTKIGRYATWGLWGGGIKKNPDSWRRTFGAWGRTNLTWGRRTLRVVATSAHPRPETSGKATSENRAIQGGVGTPPPSVPSLLRPNANKPPPLPYSLCPWPVSPRPWQNTTLAVCAAGESAATPEVPELPPPTVDSKSHTYQTISETGDLIAPPTKTKAFFKKKETGDNVVNALGLAP